MLLKTFNLMLIGLATVSVILPLFTRGLDRATCVIVGAVLAYLSIMLAGNKLNVVILWGVTGLGSATVLWDSYNRLLGGEEMTNFEIGFQIYQLTVATIAMLVFAVTATAKNSAGTSE
ncbi:hypothetical protein BABINDRAFT_160714 [Babjeviella inositovora NRRL Y-12698]|uniref:Uncharacterized protein n=1 Tax=Babjeviella inositovora NRRL Y-12698 TaxID=984486 RepID=A0A1E3QUK2_9ASCO|nr:uncharacterized protein BABINDRAFT_160714 [Babjeviella inositovora NRRL Y-12698]ODQ81361.1 hypothetical protein BABINDRAFT_160714 [Babjeviella inositovora NRRL Y-12698]